MTECKSGPWNQAIAAIVDPMARELARRGQIRSYSRNSVIINEGDSSDTLYVILAGKVKVYVSDLEGREMILDEYGAGEYFGEMALDGEPRSASVMALELTTCTLVNRDVLREVIASAPEVAMQLIITLIERARAATENVKHLALRNVYGRVSRLLMSLAREANDGTWVVPTPMTQQEIGNRVGASRDMISRIFKDLQKGGYISILERRITIHRRPPARW